MTDQGYIEKDDAFSKLQKDAEEFVISIAVLHPPSIDLMSAIVARRDFIDRLLGKVWQLVVDLREAEEGFDVKKFITECVKRGYVKDIGGMPAMAKILDKAPNHAMAEYYARELARLSEIRRLENAIYGALDELRDANVDPVKISHQLQARIEGVGNSKDAGFQALVDVVDKLAEKSEAHDESKEAQLVFPTGIPALDGKIGGFSPGKLYLLGGRTGMGKTALACNMAVAVAEAARSVWFCSLEMESFELTERIISSAMEIELGRWRKKLNAFEMKQIGEYRKDASKLKFWLTDKGNESLSSIRAKARLRKSLGGLDLIVIDNLQLIKPVDYRAPKHERMKAMTEAMKMLAKDLNVAILLLCQLSVDAEPSKDGKVKKPDNTAWADSKRIPDDADVAMILHRENKADKKGELIITKNRNGTEGDIGLNWSGAYQRFTDEQIDSLGGFE